MTATQSLTNKTGKKKNLVIISSILVLVLGIAATVAGAAIMYLNTGNDFEGYAISESYTVKTSANAFVLWVGYPQSSDNLKWVITSESSQEVFAGWGKETSVKPYVAGFKYESPDFAWNYIARAYYAKINIPLTSISNTANPVRPPTHETVWLSKVSTSNSTTLYSDFGDSSENLHMLVIMNADGSSGVNAKIQLGSKVFMYGWLPYLLIPIGIILLIIGLLLFKRNKKQKR